MQHITMGTIAASGYAPLITSPYSTSVHAVMQHAL